MYNVSLSPHYKSKNDEYFPFICSPDDKHGMLHCHDVPPYKHGGETCPLAAPHHVSALNELVPTGAAASANACVNWNLYYNVCRAGDHNPHLGAVNFDHIANAWLAIFQVRGALICAEIHLDVDMRKKSMESSQMSVHLSDMNFMVLVGFVGWCGTDVLSVILYYRSI